MIDIDDLRDLRVCKKCKHVYMPNFTEGSAYEEPISINDNLCNGCGGRQKL